MKQLLITIPASVSVTVQIADDATDEQIKAAVEAEVGKYVTLKNGQDFDSDEYQIINEDNLDEAGDLVQGGPLRFFKEDSNG